MIVPLVFFILLSIGLALGIKQERRKHKYELASNKRENIKLKDKLKFYQDSYATQGQLFDEMFTILEEINDEVILNDLQFTSLLDNYGINDANDIFKLLNRKDRFTAIFEIFEVNQEFVLSLTEIMESYDGNL